MLAAVLAAGSEPSARVSTSAEPTESSSRRLRASVGLIGIGGFDFRSRVPGVGPGFEGQIGGTVGRRFGFSAVLGFGTVVLYSAVMTGARFEWDVNEVVHLA